MPGRVWPLSSTGPHTWQPADVRVAHLRDLGCVYDSVQSGSVGTSESIEACYLRVGKQFAGKWQLLIDVEWPVVAA